MHTALPEPRVVFPWPRRLLLVFFGVALFLPWLLLAGSLVLRGGKPGPQRAARLFLRNLEKNDPELNQQLSRDFKGIVPRHVGTVLPFLEPILSPAETAVHADHACIGFALRPRNLQPGEKGYRPLSPTEKKLIQQWDGRGLWVYLNREEGHWRVAGLHIGQPDGTTISVETPPTVPLQPRQAELFQSLTPMTRAEAERLWLVDRELKGQPPLHLLEQLAKEMNLTLDLSPWQKERLTKPLGEPLVWRGASRVRIVEELAARLKLQPVYPYLRSSNKLSFTPGPRSSPVAHAGPFLVESLGVNEQPGLGTGTLRLGFHLPGPSPALAGLLERFALRPTISVRAADGRDLLHSERYTRTSWPPARWRELQLELNLSVPLRFLTQDVARLAEVRGQVAIQLPVRVEQRTLSLARLPLTTTIDGCQLTITPGLDGLDTVKATSVRLRVEVPAGKVLFWVALDDRRKPVSTSPAIRATNQEMLLTTAAALMVKVATCEELLYPFHFRDIPRAPRPPERIEPLKYPGHPHPVTVRASKRPGGLQIAVLNHSQKEIEEIHTQIRCLDLRGRLLLTRSWQRPLPRQVLGYAITGMQKAEDGTLLVDVPGTWPAIASHYEVDVEMVMFTDGTTWSPEARREERGPSKPPAKAPR